MYRLSSTVIAKNDERLPIIIKLFKEVLGYTDEEIEQFISFDFMCTVAENLTLEQISLIAQPFEDNDVLMVFIEDEMGKFISYNDAGIYLVKNPPKDHYEHPLISHEHLVDPWTQRAKDRQINLARRAQQEREERIAKTAPVKVTCPTCGSANTRKMGSIERGASIITFGIFSKKINKTFKCESCSYTW